jgi:long-chain acyl-CoA synthetase
MPFENIGLMLQARMAEFAEETAARFKIGADWNSLTYAQFWEEITALATAMTHNNMQQGDNVAIYSPNCYQWAVADYAMAISGIVSVPIYATNTKDQAAYIIKEAGIRLIFAGSNEQYKNLTQIRREGVPLKIVVFDRSVKIDTDEDSYYDAFLKQPTTAEISGIEETLHGIKADDTTTIIYTSGTTGDPKGVMLTHRNLFHQLEAVDANFDVSAKDTSLCFLPLSHVYERMWSLYIYYRGATNTYLDDPKKVIETMQEVKPTAMVSVPRLYEKIYATIMNRQEEASGFKKKLFACAIATGALYQKKRQHGETISLKLKLKHKMYDKLVLSKIRAVVGGDKNFFSAGGAPLEKAIEEFFFACGLLICQGYGMTETSPMISANTPDDFKFGTVGKVVPNCRVKIADNGEIMVKGPLVMKGYYRKPEATAETIVDGWLKTGDVGEFDKDGFLRITDRIKDIIITSGGKNIAPLRIETLIGKDFFIEQIVAIGDKRNFISALIVPAFESLEAWAKRKRIEYTSTDELVEHPHVIEFFKKRIDLHSKFLASYESVKKFKLLPKPLTMEDGEITPTLKLKRKQINEKFKALIDSMYQREEKSGKPVELATKEEKA